MALPLSAALAKSLLVILFHEQPSHQLAAARLTFTLTHWDCLQTYYWERYVRWLDSKGMAAEADAALQRATNVFCRGKWEIFIFAGRYMEKRGRVEEARAHFKTVLETMMPGLLSAVVAAANFERRQGSISAACAVWEAAIEKEKEGAGTGNSKLYAYMAMHYATFLREVAAQPDRAREVLQEALRVAPHIRNLWEAAIHLELSLGDPGAYSRIAPLFECACAEPPAREDKDGPFPLSLSDKDREELSARSVEIADDLGDIEALLAAQTAHGRRFAWPTSFAAAAAAAGLEPAERQARKRKDKDTSQSGAAAAAPEDGPSKAARVDPAAAAAAAATAAAHAAYHQYPAAPAPAAYPGYPPAAYSHYPAYGYGQSYGQGHYGYGY